MRKSYLFLKQWAVVLFVLLVASVIVHSCKKDVGVSTSEKDLVNEAKDWYYKEVANTKLVSTHGDSLSISLKPNWHKALDLKLSDNTNLYVVSIETDMPEKLEKRFEPILLIHKRNTDYELRVINKLENESILTNKVDKDKLEAQKLYEMAFGKVKQKIPASDALTIKLGSVKMTGLAEKTLNGNQIKIMGGVTQDPFGAPPVQCTEWYLITTYTDGRQTSEYLYTTCTGGGNGNGGGGGSSSGIAQIITPDTSILNNAKAKCALGKLLGKNVKFDSLTKAFTGTTYNLKFGVRDVLTNTTPGNDPRGETVFDSNDPYNIQINIKRSFVNGAKPIEIAKTLLHEAFHANLIQRAYEVFGNSTISTWTKSPKNMELNELIDIFEAKLDGIDARDTHHAYIAKNVDVIAKGLQQFAKDYDNNYNNSNYYDYLALAYQGLTDNSYFENKIKETQIYYLPGIDGIHMRADSLVKNKGNRTKSDSDVSCN